MSNDANLVQSILTTLYGIQEEIESIKESIDLFKVNDIEVSNEQLAKVIKDTKVVVENHNNSKSDKSEVDKSNSPDEFFKFYSSTLNLMKGKPELIESDADEETQSSLKELNTKFNTLLEEYPLRTKLIEDIFKENKKITDEKCLPSLVKSIQNVDNYLKQGMSDGMLKATLTENSLKEINTELKRSSGTEQGKDDIKVLGKHISNLGLRLSNTMIRLQNSNPLSRFIGRMGGWMEGMKEILTEVSLGIKKQYDTATKWVTDLPVKLGTFLGVVLGIIDGLRYVWHDLMYNVLGEWFDKHPALKTIRDAITTFVADHPRLTALAVAGTVAFPKILNILGLISGGIGSIFKGISTVIGIGWKALGYFGKTKIAKSIGSGALSMAKSIGAFAISPPGLAIIGISAAIAGITYLVIRYRKEIAEALKKFWEWLGKIFKGIGNFIKAYWKWLGNIFKRLFNFIINLPKTLFNLALKLPEYIVNKLKEFWTWIKDKFSNSLSKIPFIGKLFKKSNDEGETENVSGKPLIDASDYNASTELNSIPSSDTPVYDNTVANIVSSKESQRQSQELADEISKSNDLTKESIESINNTVTNIDEESNSDTNINNTVINNQVSRRPKDRSRK